MTFLYSRIGPTDLKQKGNLITVTNLYFFVGSYLKVIISPMTVFLDLFSYLIREILSEQNLRYSSHVTEYY